MLPPVIRRCVWVCGLCLAAAALPQAVQAADSVTLTSGLILEGDITVENDQLIKIKVNRRVMQFPRSAIASIEYGPESTAPSQLQAREAESQDDLKMAQDKVKTIKLKRKKKKKKKKAKEPETVTGPATIAADGTLNVPDKPTPEEAKWIKELRTGKNKIGACRELAKLKSAYAIPTLIRTLDNTGPYVRREANDALKKITAQDFRFKHDERKRSIRVEAIKKWQKWYEKASGKRVPW